MSQTFSSGTQRYLVGNIMYGICDDEQSAFLGNLNPLEMDEASVDNKNTNVQDTQTGLVWKHEGRTSTVEECACES